MTEIARPDKAWRTNAVMRVLVPRGMFGSLRLQGGCAGTYRNYIGRTDVSGQFFVKCNGLRAHADPTRLHHPGYRINFGFGEIGFSEGEIFRVQ